MAMATRPVLPSGQRAPARAAPARVLLTTVGLLDIRARARYRYSVFRHGRKIETFLLITSSSAPIHILWQSSRAGLFSGHPATHSRCTSRSPGDGRSVSVPGDRVCLRAYLVLTGTLGSDQ